MLDLQRSGRAIKRSSLYLCIFMVAVTLLVVPAAAMSACALKRSKVLKDDEYDSRGKPSGILDFERLVQNTFLNACHRSADQEI